MSTAVVLACLPGPCFPPGGGGPRFPGLVLPFFFPMLNQYFLKYTMNPIITISSTIFPAVVLLVGVYQGSTRCLDAGTLHENVLSPARIHHQRGRVIFLVSPCRPFVHRTGDAMHCIASWLPTCRAYRPRNIQGRVPSKPHRACTDPTEPKPHHPALAFIVPGQ